jgi:hypothetical protein
LISRLHRIALVAAASRRRKVNSICSGALLTRASISGHAIAQRWVVFALHFVEIRYRQLTALIEILNVGPDFFKR